MGSEEIAQKLISGRGLSWDACAEKDADIKDLDKQLIDTFIKAVRKAKRRPIPRSTDQIEIIEKLGLLVNEKPTRAALLLFGNDPQKFSPSAYLQVGRFRSLIDIVDSHEFTGNVLSQIEQCMNWFRDKLETKYVITGKPQRDTIWEYPLEALREAVTNAVCHRDYRSESSTQIRLFDTSVEIRNPGALPPPLKAADLLKVHPSILRNRRLAESLFNMGLIEKWGSGTLRIVAELKLAGKPEPEFNASEIEQFSVTLHNRPNVDRLKQLELNDREIQAVLHLAEYERLTNLQYQELYSISKRTATRELDRLITKGLIKRHGTTGVGTYYTLNK